MPIAVSRYAWTSCTFRAFVGFIVELLSEATTLGAVGFVGLLMLAQPAFRLTSDDFLSRQDLAVTFLGRNGVEIGKRGLKQDATIPLSEFPDHLLKAVFATEDRRFYDHFGIDPVGLLRALTVNARASGVVQGGSTLTQQLAKNIFLTNERSLDRKVKEAFLSVWLERRLTKSQILKLYLDRAYMGGGTFGVAAASEYYFGKSVKDISLAEAAMLAGLFKAPTKYGPYVNLPAARARANDVLSNMVDAGFMTEGQVLAARQKSGNPPRSRPRLQPRLLSRLRLRRSAQARRCGQARRRALRHRAHLLRRRSAAQGRELDRSVAARRGRPLERRAGRAW